MNRFLFISAFSLATLTVPVFSYPSDVGSTGENHSNLTSVVADVDGTKLTLGDLEQKRANALFKPRDTYYQSERKVLDDYITEIVVRKQAEKEGLTLDQLIEKHVKSALPPDPSDEALRVYYEGLDAKSSFESMKPKILEHIRQNRFEKAKSVYFETLRSKANVVISLPSPRLDIPLANTPVLGSSSAPVVVVEYADYECPYCQQAAPAVQRLKEEYKDKIAFAFKDVPLSMHPLAQKAAEAAHCAGDQGKFWEFHETLFATKQLAVPDLKQDAQKMNLNMTAFNQCLDSGAQASLVKAQFDEAQKWGLEGTPAFFINGRFLSGAVSYEQLRSVVDDELATAAGNQPKQTAKR